MYLSPEFPFSIVLSQFVIGLLEFTIVYVFCNNFFVRYERRLLWLLLPLLGFAAVSTAVNLLQLPVLNTLAALVLDYMLCMLLFEGGWHAKLKFSVICTAVSVISEIGVGLIQPVLAAHFPALREAFSMPFVLALCSKLIFGGVVMGLVLAFPKRYSLAQAPGGGWVLLFPVLGAGNMHLILHMRWCTEDGFKLPLFLMGAMMLLSTMAPLVIYDANLKRRKLESELRLLAEREQSSRVFYLAQERSLDELLRQSHDFKNHLINLRDLYGRGTPEAEAYFASLVENLEAKRDPCPIKIGNAVVSNIIGRVRGQCAEHGIRFTLSIDCGSLAFLRLIDASAIFDNALDNAISACLTQEKPEMRSIRLSILEHKYYVSVHVVNTKGSAVCEKGGRLLSTKEQAERHGYGLENIRISSQKYGGDISYEYDDTTFSLWVRLGKTLDPLEKL